MSLEPVSSVGPWRFVNGGGQILSVKGQIVNILGSTGHTAFVVIASSFVCGKQP